MRLQVLTRTGRPHSITDLEKAAAGPLRRTLTHGIKHLMLYCSACPLLQAHAGVCLHLSKQTCTWRQNLSPGPEGPDHTLTTLSNASAPVKCHP